MAMVIPPRGRLIRPRQVRKPATFILDPTHPLSRGLVAYYPLGDTLAGVSADISQYDKPATINVTSGAPVLSPSHHGGLAYNANAGTNFLTANSPPVTAVPLSFSIWSKLTALPGSNVEEVMMALNALGSNNEFWMSIWNNAGVIKFRGVIQFSGAARWLFVTFGDTNWHHYVIVFRTATVFDLYIDGVPQSTTGGGTGSTAPSGIDTTSIGGFNFNSGSYYGQWNGLLEGARVYNRALTPAEVAQLYAEPYAGVYDRPQYYIGSAAPASLSAALSESADTSAIPLAVQISLTAALHETSDTSVIPLKVLVSLAIAATESPDSIYVPLGTILSIILNAGTGDQNDSMVMILSNTGSWADCADPATAWSECTDATTTWTSCPAPSTNWTVN